MDIKNTGFQPKGLIQHIFGGSKSWIIRLVEPCFLNANCN
nr:MAG TPA: hypothetical protein [Caudoviricetes sp.]